jgi:hypothetical protein
VYSESKNPKSDNITFKRVPPILISFGSALFFAKIRKKVKKASILRVWNIDFGFAV